MPFLKDVSLELGIFYILFVIMVITGSSNAVNLTDGLDGLAIGLYIMVALAFSVLSYVSGNIKFSSYLLIPYIKGSGELTVFCASILGAGLGFYGLTVIRPLFLWEMWVLWLWAGPWGQ